MSSPAIFDGKFAKLLTKNLRFANKAAIMTGYDDPTSTPIDAIAGSIYMLLGPDPAIFHKQDDGSSTNWIPFKEQDALDIFRINGTQVHIRGGYLMLSTGSELGTYDGSGVLSTDFGNDLVYDIGSGIADGKYYIYIDIESLDPAITQSDSGRKTLPIVPTNFILSTYATDSVWLGRYIPIGGVNVVAEEIESAFPIATRKHERPIVWANPRKYSLEGQPVSYLGSGQETLLGHHYKPESFKGRDLFSKVHYWNIDASGISGLNSADSNLLNTTPFPLQGIAGSVYQSSGYAFSNNTDYRVLNGKALIQLSTPSSATEIAFGSFVSLPTNAPTVYRSVYAYTLATAASKILDVSISNSYLRLRIYNSANAVSLTASIPYTFNTNEYFRIDTICSTNSIQILINGKVLYSATVSWRPDAQTFNLWQRLYLAESAAPVLADVTASNALIQSVYHSYRAASDKNFGYHEIRKLSCGIVNHNANLAPQFQKWAARTIDNNGIISGMDDESWLLDQSDHNMLFVDLRFVNVQQNWFVDLLLDDTSYQNAAVASTKHYDSGWTFDPLDFSLLANIPVLHGLPNAPTSVQLFTRDISGRVRSIPVHDYIEWDSNAIYNGTSSINDLLVNPVSSVRLVAGVGDTCIVELLDAVGSGGGTGGGSTEGIVTEETAGVNLSGLRVVRYGIDGIDVIGNVYTASLIASEGQYAAIGLTKDTVAAGNLVEVTKAGLITLDGTHYLPAGSIVYLGANGTVVPVIPTNVGDAIVRIGTVKDSLSIEVNIDFIGIVQPPASISTDQVFGTHDINIATSGIKAISIFNDLYVSLASNMDNQFVLGVTVSSAAQFEPVDVIYSGKLSLPSHGLGSANQKLWVGENGTVTTIRPTASQSMMIELGTILNNDTLFIRVQVIGRNA